MILVVGYRGQNFLSPIDLDQEYNSVPVRSKEEYCSRLFHAEISKGAQTPLQAARQPCEPSIHSIPRSNLSRQGKNRDLEPINGVRVLFIL